ncbi:MAG TPA: hypothetical protein VH044_17795 [Polyangiaceae bacterium]|jgi:hypothetical protein|nr:hypothetical protein [Polyangiaceae bacterium]
MILHSLRHSGWLALVACAGVAACSKQPATETAYVDANVGPGSGAASTLCSGLGSQQSFLAVGAMASNTQPTTVPEGTNNLTIDCSVAASGDGYDIQLNASLPGPQQLIVTGHVDATNGGSVYGEFVNNQWGAFQQKDCTLTFTYFNNDIPMNERLTQGSIFAHVSCPEAVIQGASITGTQINLPDGGIANETCDAEADFLFQNCN